MSAPSFSHGDYQVDTVETVYSGFFQLRRVAFRHRLFAGGWSRPIWRELLVRGEATCVLPYDPWRDCVVFCEQFRVGGLEHARSPWLLELVAGINEPGESPEVVARREAVEEAGLELLAMERICDYLPSPGGSSERVELWCAQVRAPVEGGIFGLLEEGEEIRTRVVERERAMQWLAGGQIWNAATIIALQWLALHHVDLRARWEGRPEQEPDPR